MRRRRNLVAVTLRLAEPAAMALVRTEITAIGCEEARRLLDLYRKGEREPRLGEAVLDQLTRLGKTARSRPHLAGVTNHNPPILLFDTDVYAET